MSIFAILKRDYECELLQFVLMSNHYHLLIYTPLKNLSASMLYLHREIAKRANLKSQRINHFFGGRYKSCLIDSEQYYWNCIKYIFRNPVDAGMCEYVEDYPFSTLNRSCPDFMLNDFFLNRDKKIHLDSEWLNHGFSKEQMLIIKKGLSKNVFAIHKSRHQKLSGMELEYHRNDGAHPL